MLKFFAEKVWLAFAVQKLLTFFQQKISEYCILYLLKQLTKWPLTSLLLWTTGPRYFFFLSPWKHMLWVLIRSTSLRHTLWVQWDASNEYPNMFSRRNKKLAILLIGKHVLAGVMTEDQYKIITHWHFWKWNESSNKRKKKKKKKWTCIFFMCLVFPRATLIIFYLQRHQQYYK